MQGRESAVNAVSRIEHPMGIGSLVMVSRGTRCSFAFMWHDVMIACYLRLPRNKAFGHQIAPRRCNPLRFPPHHSLQYGYTCTGVYDKDFVDSDLI